MKQHFLALAAAGALMGAAPVAAQTDSMAPDALVDAWVAAFNECSAEKISALYDAAATLWGTNSPALITTPEGVRFYFNSACAAQPSIKVSLGERTTRVVGTTATSAGTYTFVRAGKDIPARFSFTLLRANDHWRIIQHHSSLLPGHP